MAAFLRFKAGPLVVTTPVRPSGRPPSGRSNLIAGIVLVSIVLGLAACSIAGTFLG